MPARRSRTERFRDSLLQIKERRGGLEIGLPPVEGGAPATDVLWRVRLLDVTDDEMIVEQPGAAGQTLSFDDGLDLVGVMTIGQNRWMFHTRTLGPATFPASRHAIAALRLTIPEGVERCQRRAFYRMSTAELSLPSVRCWPVLDPMTLAAAEATNRAQVMDAAEHDQVGTASAEGEPIMLPEVGPGFRALLNNISAGGIGLVVDPDDASGVDSSRLVWLCVDLRPHVAAPLAMTAKVVHSHRDSDQRLHVGCSFDFAFNPEHRLFIVDQVGRYIARAMASRARRHAV